MKSQKGVTLTSLAIYIALIFIILGILATITANIQGNIKKSNNDGSKMTQINKFNMYFVQEVKKQGNSIQSIDDNSISFSSGKTFIYNSSTKTINLLDGENSIEIANNIKSCTFSDSLKNGKTVISVNIIPENADLNPELQNRVYVLNSEDLTNNYENEKDYIYNMATE